MNYRKDAGNAAEQLARQHLETAGLRCLLKNYRCKVGELDLVMLEKRTLVLVEVRYRTLAQFGGAAASVDIWKQRRFINAARHLLLMHAELRRYPARFDVVAVDQNQSGAHIEWIKDAFISPHST
jgi:putative endonuclease